MKIRTLILLTLSHLYIGILGSVTGIYALPIIIAPPSPSETEIEVMSSQAVYTTEFRRDRKRSDPLYWGEGKV